MEGQLQREGASGEAAIGCPADGLGLARPPAPTPRPAIARGRRVVFRDVAACAAAVATAACAPRTAPGRDMARGATADSIVLERTRCYGFCPAYRVSITRAGRVAFASRYPDVGTRAVVDGADPGAVDALARRAAALGFDALPGDIAADSALCPRRYTDAASVIVTVYTAARSKQVTDYLGCGGGPPVVVELRRLEAAIDSAAGTARWARPGDRR